MPVAFLSLGLFTDQEEDNLLLYFFDFYGISLRYRFGPLRFVARYSLGLDSASATSSLASLSLRHHFTSLMLYILKCKQLYISSKQVASVDHVLTKNRLF